MCLESLIGKWRAWRGLVPAPVVPAVEPPPASVFDAIGRALQGGHPHLMSQFAYLNELVRPEAEKVRTVVDEFYLRYPADHRAALRHRLRSIDDVAHYGAFFELAIHELLIRAGCRILAVEPPMPGRSTSPDFLVETPNGNRFYIEATIATGQSRATTGAQKRLDDAYKAINSVSSPDFFLSVETIGKPSQSIPLKKLKTDISRWLKGLDYDKVRAAWEANQELPAFRYDEHEVVLTISPIPRGNSRGETGSDVIGAYTMPPIQVEPHKAISAAVTFKAGRYGKPGLPYLIAVNAMESHAREVNAIDGLFGTPTVTVRQTAHGPQSEETRAFDGAWFDRTGPINKRVSGVLSTERLTPWSLGQRHARLILNPWAEDPLPDLDLAVDKYVLDGDYLVKHDGKSLREVYDMSENWPE